MKIEIEKLSPSVFRRENKDKQYQYCLFHNYFSNIQGWFVDSLNEYATVSDGWLIGEDDPDLDDLTYGIPGEFLE